MKNLKKLIYKYKFLNLELKDIRDEHSELTNDFESLFSDIIGKREVETEEEIVSKATKPKVKKERITEDPAIKKLYKDVAKKLHPDKGGTEDEFKELNRRYKDSDYLGIVEIAIENDIEVEVEDDTALLKSIEKLDKKIEHVKTTLPYVWKYGSDSERLGVLKTLSMYLGVDISIDDLSENIKNLIGLGDKSDSTK